MDTLEDFANKNPGLEPADTLRRYSDHTKLELLRSGQWDDQLVSDIDTELADFGAENGLDPAELAKRPEQDDLRLTTQVMLDKDPAIADAARSYFVAQSDEARAKFADPALFEENLNLHRKSYEDLVTPEKRNLVKREAMKSGDLPFAVLDGALEFSPMMREVVGNDEALAKLFEANPNLDRSLIPAVKQKLTTAPGYDVPSFTLDRQADLYTTLQATMGKNPDVAERVNSLIKSYETNSDKGTVHTTLGGGQGVNADPTLNTIAQILEDGGLRGEFDRDELKQFVNDFALTAASPMLQDGDVDANVTKLSTGQRVLPMGVLLNKELFDRTMKESKTIPAEQKDALMKTREARVSAYAPDAFKVIADNRPEFSRFLTERKEKGSTNAAILDEWMSNPENHSEFRDYAGGIGESIVEGLGGLVLYPAALAGSDTARGVIADLQKSDSDRRAYARLFGKNLGAGYDLSRLIAPVAADVGVSILTGGAAAPMIAGKSGVKTAIKNTLRTALTAETKTALGSFTKAAARRAGAEGVMAVDDVLTLAGKDIAGTLTKSVNVASYLGTAFNRSAGSTYVQLHTQLSDQKNPDGSPKYSTEQVREIALNHGLIAGTLTAAVTGGFSMFGHAGMEGIYNGITRKQLNGIYDRMGASWKSLSPAVKAGISMESPEKMLESIMRKSLGTIWGRGTDAVISEGAEEGIDQILGYVNQQIATGDKIDVSAAIREGAYAAMLGGVMGGTVTAINSTVRGRNVAPDMERMVLLDTARKLDAAKSPQTAAVLRKFAQQVGAETPAVTTPAAGEQTQSEPLQTDESERTGETNQSGGAASAETPQANLLGGVSIPTEPPSPDGEGGLRGGRDADSHGELPATPELAGNTRESVRPAAGTVQNQQPLTQQENANRKTEAPAPVVLVRDTTKLEQMTPEEATQANFESRWNKKPVPEYSDWLEKNPKPNRLAREEGATRSEQAEKFAKWVERRKNTLWNSVAKQRAIPTSWVNDVPTKEFMTTSGYAKQGKEWVALPNSKPAKLEGWTDYDYQVAMEGVEASRQEQMKSAGIFNAQNEYVQAAIDKQQPISAAAKEKFWGDATPDGYVREGELYVYRPNETPTQDPAPQLGENADPTGTDSESAAVAAAELPFPDADGADTPSVRVYHGSPNGPLSGELIPSKADDFPLMGSSVTTNRNVAQRYADDVDYRKGDSPSSPHVSDLDFKGKTVDVSQLRSEWEATGGKWSDNQTDQITKFALSKGYDAVDLDSAGMGEPGELFILNARSATLPESAGTPEAPVSETRTPEQQQKVDRFNELNYKESQSKLPKGKKLTKAEQKELAALTPEVRPLIMETVDPENDPTVGVDINGTDIRQSKKGTYYTVENGRVRTGPAFSEETPEAPVSETRTPLPETAGDGSVKGVPADKITTPMLKSWATLSRDAPEGTLVMVRLGDFYEVFGDDAKTAAPLMQTALTKRGGIPMTGVPYHAKDSYFKKLTDAGHTVALAEQVGKVREITETVAPSLITQDTTPSESVQRMDAEEAEYKARPRKQTGAELQAEYYAQQKSSSKPKAGDPVTFTHSSLSTPTQGVWGFKNDGVTLVPTAGGNKYPGAKIVGQPATGSQDVLQNPDKSNTSSADAWGISPEWDAAATLAGTEYDNLFKTELAKANAGDEVAAQQVWEMRNNPARSRAAYQRAKADQLTSTTDEIDITEVLNGPPPPTPTLEERGIITKGLSEATKRQLSATAPGDNSHREALKGHDTSSPAALLASLAKSGPAKWKPVVKLLQQFDWSGVTLTLLDTNIPVTVDGRQTTLGGAWMRETGQIIIAPDSSKAGTVETVLHEMIHAATEKSLLAPTEAQKKVLKRIGSMRSKLLKLAGDDANLRYGLSNDSEFLSHMLTSEPFRASVEALTPPKQTSFVKLLFDAIADLLLGKKKLPGVTGDMIADLTTFVKSGDTVLGVVRVPESGARFMFAGEKAAKPAFMQDSLETARTMAAAGKTSEEIRAATGWFPGKYDGKMRWEIPDSGATWKQIIAAPPYPVELKEVLKHPTLYEAYPAVANLRVAFDGSLPKNVGGHFNPRNGLLTLNNQNSDTEKLSSTLHEVQHWIQDHEGMAQGTSPSEESYSREFALTPEQQQTVDGLKSRREELLSEKREVDNYLRTMDAKDRFSVETRAKSDRRDAIDDELHKNYSQETRLTNKARDAFGFSRYTRTAGEIEARDVQARANMTPEQLAATAPYSSENIAPEAAIVMGVEPQSAARFSPTPEFAKSIAPAGTDLSALDLTGLEDMNPLAAEDAMHALVNREIGHAAGMRMSVVPDDQAYLAAVESGDMETAQRMVDEAAKAAGGSIYYRGGEQFTIADMRKPYVWLAESRNYAKNYGVPKRMFVFSSNPLDLAEYGEDQIYRMTRKEIVDLLQSKGVKVSEEDLNTSKLGGGEPLFRVFTSDQQGVVKRALESAGYDSVKFIESRTLEAPPAEDVTLVFNPTQIKSADPVTRDDQGNVIPLSQRFNATSPDIRFSPAPELRLRSTLDNVTTGNPSNSDRAHFITNPEQRPALVSYLKGAANAMWDRLKERFDPRTAVYVDRLVAEVARAEDGYKVRDVTMRMSVVPDDQAYLAAVESGDMETAQRMVDEAAKAAGYDVGPFFHGTESNFTVFDKGGRVGIYFTPDEKLAKAYGRKVLKVYAKITKGAKVDAELTTMESTRKGYDALAEVLKNHDGLIAYPSNGGSREVLLRDPNQVKSAEPVTLDDQGNVIPLSQRFNATSPDIRFSPAPATDADGNLTFEHVNFVFANDNNKLFVSTDEDINENPGWFKRMFARRDDMRKPLSAIKVSNEALYGVIKSKLDRLAPIYKKGVKEEGSEEAMAHLGQAIGSNKPMLTPEAETRVNEGLEQRLKDAENVEDENAAFEWAMKAAKDEMIAHADEMRRASGKSMEWLEGNAPKLHAWAKEMRDTIDEFQTLLAEHYRESRPEMAWTIDNSRGVYLTRTWRIHQDPAFAEMALHDPEFADKQAALIELFAKDLTETELKKLQRDPDNANVNEADLRVTAYNNIQEKAKAMFQDYVMGHEFSASSNVGSTGLKTEFQRFMRKRNLDTAIEDVLGRIDDPKFNADRTLAAVSGILFNQKMLTAIKDEGIQSGTIITEAQKNADKVKYRDWKPLVSANVHSAAYAPLAGYYASPRDVEAMNAAFGFNRGGATDTADKAMDTVNKIILGASGMSLATMTLGSPGYFVRNLNGGMIGSLAQGVIPLTSEYRKSMGLAWDYAYSKEGGDIALRERLIALRIIGDGVQADYVKELRERYKKDPVGLLKWATAKGLKIPEAAKTGKLAWDKLVDVLERTAEFTETSHNAAVFFYDLDALVRSGLYETQEAAEQEAARINKMVMPSKSEKSQALDKFSGQSWSALVAPFARFRAEMFRTVVNTYKIGLEHARSDNAVLRKHGQQRLAAAFTMHAGITVMIPLVLQSLLDFSDEEDKAIRAALPSYSQSSQLWMWDKGNGSIRMLDLTYANQFSFVFDIVPQIWRSRKDPLEMPEVIAKYVAGEVIGENIVAGSLLDVSRNMDEQTGNTIWLKTDDFSTKVAKATAHVIGGSYTPAVLKKMSQAILAGQRPSKEGEDFFYTPLGILTGMVLPAKPYDRKIEDMAYRAFRSLGRENRELWQITAPLSSPAGLSDSPADIYQERVRAAVKVWGKAHRLAKSYESMGMSKAKILSAMTEAGLSQKRASMAMKGFAERPVLDADKLRDIREIDVRRYEQFIEAMRSQPRVLDVR